MAINSGMTETELIDLALSMGYKRSTQVPQYDSRFKTLIANYSSQKLMDTLHMLMVNITFKY